MIPCTICKKFFSSKNSLRTHKSRFHNGKILPLQSTFGGVITARRDINRKRYPCIQDISDESTDTEGIEKSKLMNKKLSKKRPLVMEETSDDSDVEINRRYKRIRSFYEIFYDPNLSFGDQCDEYINKL